MRRIHYGKLLQPLLNGEIEFLKQIYDNGKHIRIAVEKHLCEFVDRSVGKLWLSLNEQKIVQNNNIEIANKIGNKV